MRPPFIATLAAAAACGRSEDDADPCALGAQVDSIDAVVDTLDRLPHPVSLPCFVTALARPLGVVLTSDVFSTQPAQGARSPRILIRNPTLALTVVPVGEARELLELGEAHPESGFTVKAELAFPIGEGPVDPYVRTLAYPGASESGCHVCHFSELALGDGRFANAPLRPPDNLVVPLEVLVDENAVCDPAEDADRCEMLSALLDHGDVVERPFADTVATQFGPPP